MQDDRSALVEKTPGSKEEQPITPRPIEAEPDYTAIRRKLIARFSKTLAYLADH